MKNKKIENQTSELGASSTSCYSRPQSLKKVHCPNCQEIFTLDELVEVHFPTCQGQIHTTNTQLDNDARPGEMNIQAMGK